MENRKGQWLDELLGLMLVIGVVLLWRRQVRRGAPPVPRAAQARQHDAVQDEGVGWYVFGYHRGRDEAHESCDGWEDEWHGLDGYFDDEFDD